MIDDPKVPNGKYIELNEELVLLQGEAGTTAFGEMVMVQHIRIWLPTHDYVSHTKYTLYKNYVRYEVVMRKRN